MNREARLELTTKMRAGQAIGGSRPAIALSPIPHLLISLLISRSPFRFGAYIERRDPEAQRIPLDALQPLAAHQVRQRFAVGKLQHARRQVIVSRVPVASHCLTPQWQDP